MPSAKPEPIELNVWEIARDLLDKNDNNLSRAVDALVTRAERDRGVFEAVAQAQLRSLCANIVGRVWGSERSRIWHGGVTADDVEVIPPLSNSGKAIADIRQQQRALAVGRLMLMDFPLFGGLTLRDANRADVEQSADEYEMRGSDMLTKAKWLRLIARRMSSSKSVQQSLTEDALRSLKRKAEATS